MKRIYEAAEEADGRRVLVDRLWPRGLSKERAEIHAWLKDLAPSDELRKWFHAHPEEWDEFRRRYFHELDMNQEAVSSLVELVKEGVVTLLFSSARVEGNNAHVLRDYIQARLDEER
ncbi:DUF488 family protein [Chelativorans sp. SCAU2101]|uniref:DUF488 family protein n=1 Tax=Chelativorans petroleitrophicus TaxID=2975484 RepID=A0A9X2X7X2_9HYPH|nr:DUF488 family protein [Chelativorans petroleitrophicus]